MIVLTMAKSSLITLFALEGHMVPGERGLTQSTNIYVAPTVQSTQLLFSFNTSFLHGQNHI